MKFITPTLAHEKVVTKLYELCCKDSKCATDVNWGQTHETMVGSSCLSQFIVSPEGYKMWIRSLRLNSTAKQCRSNSLIFPGHTFLVTEDLVADGNASTEYLQSLPYMGDNEYLIGVLNMRTVMFDQDDPGALALQNTTPTVDFKFTLLPELSTPAYYTMLLLDAMSFIVREGLPYCHVQVARPFLGDNHTEENIKAVELWSRTLVSCGFATRAVDEPRGVCIEEFDITAAHKLYSRLQKWKEER